MNINFGLAKYSYKLIVTIMACILSEKTMSKAAKFLRESEGNDEQKKRKQLFSKE